MVLIINVIIIRCLILNSGYQLSFFHHCIYLTEATVSHSSKCIAFLIWHLFLVKVVFFKVNASLNPNGTKYATLHMYSPSTVTFKFNNTFYIFFRCHLSCETKDERTGNFFSNWVLKNQNKSILNYQSEHREILWCMLIFICIQFILKCTLPYRKINVEANHLLFWKSVKMMIIGFRIMTF